MIKDLQGEQFYSLCRFWCNKNNVTWHVLWRKTGVLLVLCPVFSLVFRIYLVSKGGTDMDQQKMGAFLKKLRNEKDLTQEQLAEKFGVSRRSVSRWEGGYNLPDIDILIEMSDFYEVELKELLNGERKNEQMENKEKEMAFMVTDYNIEKNMKDAKVAIGFFIAGLVGVIASLILRNVDIGHTFFSGLIYGICDGVGPGAMIVGLCYACTNIKSLREAKERILRAQLGNK